MKNSKEITIRNAALDDAEKIVKLVNLAYRGEAAKEGWTTEADILDGERINVQEVRDLISAEHSEIILAMDSESQELLGCVHVKQEGQDTLYFGLLAVNPKLQARGVGKILLDQVSAKAQQKNLKKVRLTIINLRTDFFSYYERKGFKFTGKEEVFPKLEFAKVPGIKLLEMIKDL